jgi:prepilin-type N-terminal cleavage/methylation domain-containing protein
MLKDTNTPTWRRPSFPRFAEKKMTMTLQTTKTFRGFSLVELLIAMAVGLVILGAVTQLFKNGMDASRMVSQRAEMQDNVRAAINMIAKDVTLAGSGLPPGGLSLPFGGGAVPSLYGRDQTPKNWMNPNTYPTGVFGPAPGTPVTNYMYGLVPGPANGMESGGPGAIPATGQAADAITSIYVDYTFPLGQYNIAFTDPLGGGISVTVPAPAPVPAIPAVINGPGGIQVGDLILLSNANGSAVGEVTNVAANAITFAAGDKLNINQPGVVPGPGAGGNIRAICIPVTNCTAATTPPPNAYRLYAVSYFVEVPAAAGQMPKLMRQVDGRTPQPVADNIIGLNFTYDVCDGSVITLGNTPNCAGIPGLFPAYTPNDVHKVDINVMGQSILSYGNHSQNMQLTTSVSTRDLTFKDRYQ